MTDPLAAFHPYVRNWFSVTFARPTDVQAASWPVIARGGHVLVTAPTGSGKTLTAFLWAIDGFASGRCATGATRVLYVSPLKALNNDIATNLLQPLMGLRAQFAAAGAEFPTVRAQVRSGDTSPGERQRMLRRPPEILITTPESLLLLLTTARGRSALASVETVILDEVHAIADNRRGTVLMSSLERLQHITGRLQRIALSATVRPIDTVAAFVAGSDSNGTARPLDSIIGKDQKTIAFQVRFPAAVRTAVDAGQNVWEPLTDEFRRTISANAATLFFTNSRRLAEKLTLLINDAATEPVAYAHHGSLSREIRHEVEKRLKAGAMRAIVATNSLEMGIDIGAIDEVVMIQSPPSITSAIQRIGRAGHRVGDVSRGTLFPTHAHDFLEAAVLAECIETHEIEPLQPIANPLDVLAQILISMTATETWNVDAAYALLRQSHPYRTLPREQYDLVVEMLAGRYVGARVRDLQPRVVFDRIEHTLRATKGAVYALYNSGGTIPDRGYYHLRHSATGAVVGDLDEEFVWEATIGQVFSFGSQHWRVERITHNDVLATPAASASAPPFWRAEAHHRSFFYSERIGAFLEHAEQLLDAGDAATLLARLTSRHGFETTAAVELCEYLQRQRAHTNAALPHRHHLLVELVRNGPGGYRSPEDEQQLVLHTGWGGRVNRPFALALSAAWQDRFDEVPELYVDDNAVVVQTRAPPDPRTVFDLVTSGNVDMLLRGALLQSGFFGARFRECAGRALLVTRQRFNQRMPLWMSRLHAKRLLTTVKPFAHFPVLLETYRTCLADEFDLPALHALLQELGNGTLDVGSVVTDSPSPFAANIAWGQINRYMYADDAPESTAPSALSDDLIRAAVFDAELRPQLSRDVVDVFLGKRQRTAPGYAPTDATDFGEWLKERVMLPAQEWRTMAPADAPEPVWLECDERRWAVHAELARVVASQLFEQPADAFADTGDPRDTTQLVQEILSFHGPLQRAAIAALLPLSDATADAVIADLIGAGVLVAGSLLIGEPVIYYCDAQNLEILLRMQRAARRVPLAPRPITQLPGFLAAWHRFGRPADAASLTASLERLRAYDADVDVWLNDLLGARHRDNDPRLLDEVLESGGFVWTGRRHEVITVVPSDELALLEPAAAAPAALRDAFKDPAAHYTFFQLADRAGSAAHAFTELLWEAAFGGAVSTGSFAALRAGSARRYRLDSFAGTPRAAAPHRGLRQRARAIAQGWPGHWFLLPDQEPADESDPLRQLELAKDRARVLLDRYGIVCREFANREGGAFRWRGLFRALRVMELAGEVVAGLYFTGLDGPQFALPSALRTLAQPSLPASFWVNATDPVAPTGLGAAWPGLALPQRRASNYLAFCHGELALVVENGGRRLNFAADLDAAAFDAAAALLTHLLATHRKLVVDTINGQSAADSDLLMRLADVFDVARDHRGIELLLPARRIG
jgi:ATP-dependent helicase Lhr and Lhr-like helicase